MGSLRTYAALQVWVQAVDKAETFRTAAVRRDAAQRRVGDHPRPHSASDAKGDVTCNETFVWNQWLAIHRLVDPRNVAEVDGRPVAL